MTKRKKRALAVTLALLLVFLIAGFAGGCNAHRRPPALSARERQLLSAPPLPYSVVVQPWAPEIAAQKSQNPLAYAERVAKTLTPSGAFRSCRFENKAQATGADLIATSTGAYCNSAVIPILTGLSLGIIPTVFDDEDCEGVELRRAGAPPSASFVRIDFRSKNRVVMGWAGVIVGILPGWSYGSAHDDSRFHQRFRLEVIKHQPEIERLMRR